MTPKHGLVHFDCGAAMQGSFGFYPADYEPPLLPIPVEPDPLREQQISADKLLPLPANSPSLASLEVLGVFERSVANLFEGEKPAKILDDAAVLKLCQLNWPCKVAYLNITTDRAIQAWKEFERIKNSLWLVQEEMCSVENTAAQDFSIFRDIGSNCIDFMSHLMDSTGVYTWRHTFRFTHQPSFGNMLEAYGWRYFDWSQHKPPS